MKEIRKGKIKCMELVMDWNLWPRYEARELSHPHIVKMIDALNAGFRFPPIVVDEKSYRIVDGFHRIKAHLSHYGEDAEIEAIFNGYENEREMLLDATRLNSIHGLPLSSQDKVHCIMKLRRMKAPWPEIAEALNITDHKAKEFFEKRIGITQNGENIPLPAPVVNCLGQKMDREGRQGDKRQLTREEEVYARSAGGVFPIVYARLLINALKAGACPLKEQEVEVLKMLKTEITAAIKGFENLN